MRFKPHTINFTKYFSIVRYRSLLIIIIAALVLLSAALYPNKKPNTHDTYAPASNSSKPVLSTPSPNTPAPSSTDEQSYSSNAGRSSSSITTTTPAIASNTSSTASVSATSSTPANSSSSTATTTPTTPVSTPTPVITPPVSPGPAAGPPAGITGPTSLTVSVNSLSTDYTASTNDGSSVIWQPQNIPGMPSPVFLSVPSSAGVNPVPSVTFQVEATSGAVVGQTYYVFLWIDSNTRYTMAVTVTN